MSEFEKYARRHCGISSLKLHDFQSVSAAYVSPTIIEERQLNVAAMDVFSRLMMDRIIFLGAPIYDDAANIIQAQLLFLESVDPDKDIQIYINSPGGSVSAGLGIYDTMQLVGPDVATICTGLAASMGAVLLTAGAHRGRQPGADGRHVGIDELHGVVNTQSGRNRPAGRINIYLYVLFGIDRFEEEQLCLDDIGRVVVDRRAEEDDAIHHQAREDVHRSDVQLALLDDRRRHIRCADRLEVMQFQRTDAAMVPCVFFKF